MTFTVVWKPTAERLLTKMWLAAADRQSITNAADTIDALLRSDPLTVGESREGNSRLIYVSFSAYRRIDFGGFLQVGVAADSSGTGGR